MAETVIQVNNLTKRYDGVLAVDRISFTIAQGEIVGYLGPNGAGKSTTVKMLTGVLRPTEGSILIDGIDLLKAPIEVKRRIGYVPETGGVYESLTAYEYLQLVGRLYHIPEELLEHRIEEFLKMFGLEGVMHERLSSYSKGMKQKVLISAALLHNPKVLFLDEPLTGLDAHSALLLKELIRRLAAEGEDDLLLLAHPGCGGADVHAGDHSSPGADRRRWFCRTVERADASGDARGYLQAADLQRQY